MVAAVFEPCCGEGAEGFWGAVEDCGEIIGG